MKAPKAIYLLFILFYFSLNVKAQTNQPLYLTVLGLPQKDIMDRMKGDSKFSSVEEDIANNGEPYVTYTDPNFNISIVFYFTSEKCSQNMYICPSQFSKDMLKSLQTEGFKHVTEAFWVNDKHNIVAEFKKDNLFSILSYAKVPNTR